MACCWDRSIRGCCCYFSFVLGFQIYFNYQESKGTSYKLSEIIEAIEQISIHSEMENQENTTNDKDASNTEITDSDSSKTRH